ncbi:MAG: EscU/YscU/HrcU family type III secretion system export apparatus switch protein, partial [Phenylobacterium sp.]
MSDADAASKTEEPTPRKLEQARAKGDVVKTPDLPALASLAAAVSVMAIMGGGMTRNLAMALRPFIADAGSISLAGHGGAPLFRQAVMASAPILLMVVLAAAAAVAAGNLVQTGLMFTPDKLKFDFKKVSPVGGFKRLFGIDAGIQFGKSVVKVALTGLLAWWVLKPHLVELANLVT